MTIVVGAAAPDGNILAADSRTTVISDEGKRHRIKSDSADKVFELAERFGVATYGLAFIGPRTINGLMDEFMAGVSEEEELGDVETFAGRLGTFFNDRFVQEYGGDDGLQGWELGFLVAGYDASGIGHIWEVGIPGPLVNDTGVNTADLRGPLARADGRHRSPHQGGGHARASAAGHRDPGGRERDAGAPRVRLDAPDHPARRRRHGVVSRTHNRGHAAVQRRDGPRAGPGPSLRRTDSDARGDAIDVDWITKRWLSRSEPTGITESWYDQPDLTGGAGCGTSCSRTARPAAPQEVYCRAGVAPRRDGSRRSTGWRRGRRWCRWWCAPAALLAGGWYVRGFIVGRSFRGPSLVSARQAPRLNLGVPAPCQSSYTRETA